jgi:hypothetical protein
MVWLLALAYQNILRKAKTKVAVSNNWEFFFFFGMFPKYCCSHFPSLQQHIWKPFFIKLWRELKMFLIGRAAVLYWIRTFDIWHQLITRLQFIWPKLKFNLIPCCVEGAVNREFKYISLTPLVTYCWITSCRKNSRSALYVIVSIFSVMKIDESAT